VKHDLTCRICESGKLLHVETMFEAEGALTVSLPIDHWKDGNGRFSTVICIACGYAEWYLRGFDASQVPGLGSHAEAPPCVECGEKGRWSIPNAVERLSWSGRRSLQVRHDSGVRGGHFSLVACHGCGRTDWSAREMATWPNQQFMLIPRHCACGSDLGFGLDAVRESAGELTVARGAGGFSLVGCQVCGLVEWWAHGYAPLVEDPPEGVSVLERPAHDRQGPYR
jgi:hypothetical protein